MNTELLESCIATPQIWTDILMDDENKDHEKY